MQTRTSSGIYLDEIHPRNGDKYSPNLHSWLAWLASQSHGFTDLPQVLTDQDRALWIGFTDESHGDAPWLHGTRLSDVLCNGKKARLMAYQVGINFQRLTPRLDFWREYKADGRCAIDRAHQQAFVGNEGRWIQQGDTRSCAWCGKASQTLRRWTEVVQHEHWQ